MDKKKGKITSIQTKISSVTSLQKIFRQLSRHSQKVSGRDVLKTLQTFLIIDENNRSYLIYIYGILL